MNMKTFGLILTHMANLSHQVIGKKITWLKALMTTLRKETQHRLWYLALLIMF